MLDRATLTQMLDQLETEREAAEAEMAKAVRRVNSLRQAASGIRGLLAVEGKSVEIIDASEEATAIEAAASRLEAGGEPSNVPDPDRPRGAEAVRRVLAETEGKTWTVREMTDELERRGWAPESDTPIDAVRTALARAWRAPNSGIIRDRSKYTYRPSRNGDGPSEREEVTTDQEMSEAVLAFTGDSQQPDKFPDQPT